MNSQELMLGDLIRFSSEPYNFEEALHGKPVRVEGLRDEDGAIKVYERDTYYWSEDEDDFEPIPLTAEILEKNGWNLHGVCYINNSVGLGLRPGTDGCYTAEVGAYEYGNAPVVDIQYVHELQHILRLFGVKKEINL